jgi:PhnB protein
MPPAPDQPPLAEADQNLVKHVELPILAGHVLGSDAPESMSFTVTPGNNVYINLEPDTRAEIERLFNALAAGGTIEMPLQEMFWGDYGVHWMFDCGARKT